MSEGERAFLVFRVGDWRFGLEATAVESVVQMVEITPLPQAPGAVEGVISVGGELRPVFSIRRRFGMPPREHNPDDYLILAQTSRRAVAIPVEESLEVEMVGDNWVGKDDLGVPAEPVAGVVKTADGLVLIQDLDTFLVTEEEAQLEEALRARD